MRLATVVIIFIISVCVSNGWTMRCGNEIITEGDSEYSLSTKCGNPEGVSTDVWGDKKELYYKDNGGGVNRVEVLNGKVVNIEFERK